MSNKNKKIRNNNFKLVERWLLNNSHVQKRKYYSAKELYFIFRNETGVESVTQRGFNRNLNSCCEKYTKIQKVEKSYRKYMFIILYDNEKGSFLSKQIRINPRRGHIDNSQLRSQPPLTICPPQSHDSNSNNNSETLRNTSYLISNMKKMDLPGALSFFFGKERAEKIRKEEEDSEVLNIKTPVLYSPIIADHIRVQIKQLQFAYLTCSGWKTMIQNYEKTDKFTEFDIFNIRIKAFYLQRLYQKALDHYNTISDFNTIARMALLQANEDFGLYSNHQGENTEVGVSRHLSIITNVKTLLTWFRSYRIDQRL